jgi:hypothetical protein
MMPVDNDNAKSKLDLRRHFLSTYHADGSARVFDCCQGSALIWSKLRKEFPIASYWGVDLKAKSGRLKIDSSRVLEQPGWKENVIDVDTYGSPWEHWTAILQNMGESATVFLTIGTMSKGMQNFDRVSERALGLTFGTEELSLPAPRGAKSKGVSKKLRFEILKRDGFACGYCGATPQQRELHIDHKIPVSDGGTDDPDNLVTACADCNRGKGPQALDASYLPAPGRLPDKLKFRVPRAIFAKLRDRAVDACLALVFDHRIRVIEAIESTPGKSARYIGVRLERIGDDEQIH